MTVCYSTAPRVTKLHGNNNLAALRKGSAVQPHHTVSLWHSTLHLAILHASQPWVLMCPESEGWMLPRLQYDGRLFVPNVAPINAMLAHHLGLHTTVLRCPHTREVAQHLELIYLIENHSPQWTPPPDWQWVSRECLEPIPIGQTV
jgi:hypothetical protein